jgi:hypothetical protein
MSSFQYGGSLFPNEKSAVRALAHDILVGEQSALTAERVAEVFEHHNSDLGFVLSEWVRAVGHEPTIEVNREDFRPSDEAIVSAMRDLCDALEMWEATA